MNSVLTPFEQKIRQWQEKLAELNKSNRLLYFQEDKGDTTKIPLVPLEAFEKLVIKSESILISELNIEESQADILNRNLRKLQDKAKEVLKEKGVNTLFIALGTLKWNIKKELKEPIVSPIIIVPVELKKISKQEYELAPTDESYFVNPALLLRLKQDDINIGDEIETIKTETNLIYIEIIKKNRQNKDINKRINDNLWSLEEDTYIGLFDRKKSSMIKDLEYLEIHKDSLLNHPILQGLANDKTAYDLSLPPIIKAIDLDSYVKPESVFQILEADSSQQEVIEAAKAGMSLIVQGPPGTGKSQTIVNIIAELIAQKRKVLLVAEKPVALQVVFDRLKKSGLEDICLNFSDKDVASKKNIAKHLKTTKSKLEGGDKEQVSEDFFYELDQNRQILNQHPNNLHQKWQPLGKSAFEIYGELLKLRRENNDEINFLLRNINTWSHINLIEAKDLLKKLGQYQLFFQDKRKTVWEQSKLTSLNYEKREEIYQGIEKLYNYINFAKELGNKLAVLLNTKCPQTISELESIFAAVRHILQVPVERPRYSQENYSNNLFANNISLIDIPKIPKIWLKGDNLNLLKKLLLELENDYSLEQELSTYLNKRYKSEIFTYDLSLILAKLGKIRGWRIFRWVQEDYRENRDKIIKLCKVNISDEQLISDLEKAIKLQKIRERLVDDKYRPQIAFGKFFIKDKPDIFSIKQSLIWLDELQAYHLSTATVSELIYSENIRQQMSDTLQQLNWEQTVESIEDGFNLLRGYFVYPEKVINDNYSYFQDISFDKIQCLLDKLTDELNLFREWLDYQEILNQLKIIGLESFLQKIKNSNIDSEHWVILFEKGFYYYWLQYIYDSSNELRCFNSKIHEDKIKDFCKIDEEQYKFAKRQIQLIHADEWEKWSLQPNANKLISYLEQQETQARKSEIRQFITEAYELILTLKPCWLMNPLLVSDYIPLEKFTFDVVIFDEASQIRTEDAVSSIMRAKQIIVVGDTQQMPPTSLPGITSDDENQEEVTYDSFLAECKKFMKDRYLKWHYRSQDENLIYFSNKRFYNSQLISFPNPIKDDSRGVYFHYVEDGVYKPDGTKQQNIQEAKKVAELTLHHVRKDNKRSLGIITFSKQQANAIKVEIEELCKNNFDLANFCRDDSDNFFVKNLDNVQGDEQDIIILSCCFGKDKNGDFDGRSLGLLNRQGTDRRINVAITRARYKMILVSSIKPHMLSDGSNEGVLCLKEYFEYVENIENARKKSNDNDKVYCDFNSLLIEDIYYALEARGYQVEVSIGSSAYPIDLAVIKQHSKELLLGIECDGLTYKKYNTARDRDRLRKKILEENLNWQIHRIWSKEWFHNKEAQIEKLIERIKKLETRQ